MKWYRNKEMLKNTLEENKELQDKTCSQKMIWLLKDYNNVVKDHLELLEEKENLEKALDKACEMLNWDCPVSQNVIDDLDCENRCSPDFDEICKECWKKYFLNLADVEVINND